MQLFNQFVRKIRKYYNFIKKLIVEKEISRIMKLCKNEEELIKRLKIQEVEESSNCEQFKKCGNWSIEMIDIKSICKYANEPGPLLQIILDGIAICFSMPLAPIKVGSEPKCGTVKSFFWESSFKFSGQHILCPSFDLKKRLKNFKADSLNGQTIQLLQPLLVCNNWLTLQITKKQCYLSYYLLKWLNSNHEYYKRTPKNRPKRQQLIRAEGNLSVGLSKVQKLHQRLSIIKNQLDQCKTLHNQEE